MATMGSNRARVGAALALLAGVLLAAPARPADDDKALREKALKLNDITGTEPAKTKTLELIKDTAGAKKLVTVALAMAKEKDQPFNVNATLILARVAHFVKNYDAGERFYRLNINQALKLQSGQRIGQAYDGLSAMLFESKKYAACQKVCQELLEIEVDEKLDEELERFRPAVVRRMILSLVRQDKADDAKAVMEKLIKAQPDNLLNLELKARILRELDQNEEALKIYESILEKLQKLDVKQDVKDEYAAEIRYSMTGVYIELKKVDEAVELLKGLLEKEPNNPTFNNDLGYILADNDMNLPEAEKLIRKALEEDRKQRRKDNPDIKPEDDKDNASFLDSLGWVLYKQKKYKEAKPLLEASVKEEEGQHVEIFDHLGEVNLALGDKAAAVAAWKKGLEAAGPSKREQTRKAEVAKKIKANE